jgi:hydroxymethylglutaryl-CoA synthase
MTGPVVAVTILIIKRRRINMIGITAIGSHIPLYRLGLNEIGKMWQSRTMPGEKAVAGYDEDAVTMAVAAGLDCMNGDGKNVNGLFLGTTTAPYKEKQSAAIVAAAADLGKECNTGDFTNSLRAGSIALKAAMDAVKSGSADQILVITSDCRRGLPQGRFEQLLGDGAAAAIVGSNNVIAELEGTYSIYSDFTDLWRRQAEDFVQTADSRFIDIQGYTPIMKDAISGIMKKLSLSANNFAKVVFYAQDSKGHTELAKKLGLAPAQIQEPLFPQIGNTGTAAAFLMLVSALENAAPNDRILFVAYGDGADAFVFRVTDAIVETRTKTGIKEKLSTKIAIDYGQYLYWHNLIRVEPSTLPERPAPSLSTRWRERKAITALYGVKCKKCRTPQFSPMGQNIRVCIHCQAKDEFEPYKFSDKTGKLFSYALDQLQLTKNPPGVNGVIDFDGGGRMICELTDCDVSKVVVSMPVEMTFRKMAEGSTINYFWKAKPITL